MEDKKVSILVPVYGVEKYIKRCARSLFEQTYDNIEYIFVDDCTQDRSIDILEEVLEEYPNREKQVKILHHVKNRGLSASRNTALDASTGDYLMHVDADDYLHVDAIALLIKHIGLSQLIIFSYSIVRNEKVIPVHVQSESKTSLISKYLLNRTPASMWNKFYDAKFYKSIGIRSVEGLNQGEDYAVVPRIIEKAQTIQWLDECLYYYEQSNIQSYSNNIRVRDIAQMRMADDILYDYFSKCNDARFYVDTLKKMHIRSALFFIKKGNADVLNMIREYYQVNWENMHHLSLSDRVFIFLFITKMDRLLMFLKYIFKLIRS